MPPRSRVPSARRAGPALLLAAGLPLGLALGLTLGLPSRASAEPYAYGYGFAAPALEGAYIGAPFTRLPSTSRLVPPAWGYGTYGVPTVAGIRDAPAARPTLTVIEEPDNAGRRSMRARHGARVLSKKPNGTWTEPPQRSDLENGGARVVSIRIPARSR